ncbi:hypothetical protein Bca4012_014221 [Brassica carinata]
MMAIDNSQYISPLSSSLRKPQPQNPHPVDYIGSFMTLVSKYGLRYQGFFYNLNDDDKTLCLVNVTCYGTEGRNHIGFHIPPSYQLYSYINVVVDSPASLARGLSSKIYRLPKPPLPYAYSSYNQDGAKIRQKVPLLISNEKLSKTEAVVDDYDASSIEGPVNDGLQIACKPLALHQYPVSNYYDPLLNHVYPPMPCAALYQDLTDCVPSWIVPQSVFATFPPVPISLRPGNGGFDFEANTKNFKPYKLWGPEGDNNQDQTAYTVDGSYQNETWSSQGNNNQEDETAYNIHRSFYMNSRNPFDPIGRPSNPFSPIERPFLPSSQELADLGFV